MKNIKKIVGIFMLSAMMLTVPSTITSASVETNIKRVEEKANTIEISVDKINYEVKSFSLSLKIDGDVKLDSLKWSDDLSDSSIRKNYKYNNAENIVDIYVTSSKNLVEYSNLNVASITVKSEMDTTFDIKNNGEFKFIYSDKNKEGKMANLQSNSDEAFRFIKVGNIPDEEEDGSEEPDNDEVEKPGNGGDNNQDDSENADKDEESEDKEDDSLAGDKNDNITGDKEESSDNNVNKPNDSKEEDKSSNLTNTRDKIVGVGALALFGTIVSALGILIFTKRR